MGRTICLLLLGCLALSSAIPLPGPASEKDILNLIFNAKPEDNDIHPISPVTETLFDGIDEQPQTLQEIPEDSKAQEVPEEQKNKPESENVENTSEVLTDDKNDEPNSDPAENAAVETPEESLPVEDVDQMPTELDTFEEDQLLTEQEVAESEPQADEEEIPVILVANDQVVSLDPQETPIIIVQETKTTEGVLPEEESPFSQDGEDQLFPAREGEEFPVDLNEEEIIVISEENSDFNLDSNDDEMELVPVSEDELSQPISSDLSGLNNEETQDDADVSPFGISNPFEYSSTGDDSEIPVYFDYVNIPEPSQVNYEGVGQLFTDPIFRSSPPVYPSEDNYRPNDGALDFYYMPENRFHIEDNRYENPEIRSNVFVNQAEAVPEEEDMSDVGFSSESSVQTFGDAVPSEESLNTENVNTETDITSNQGVAPLNNEQDLIPEYTVTEEEPKNFDQDQMAPLPLEEQDLDKIGTVIVLEAPDSPVDSLEPAFEVIRLDDAPVDQEEAFPMGGPMMPDNIPESLMTPDSQPMIGNDQIMPVAEFPEEGILPINYWIPDNEDQQAIIFPEEFRPRYDLPAFPQNWNEGDISLPATEESQYPAFPSQYNEAPAYDTFSNVPSSHGPSPPQEQTEERTNSVFNLANDEMPTRNVDFINSPDIPQYPREEVIPVYDNDDENAFGQSGHIHISNDFPQTFGYPNLRTRFNRPASFGLPSMFDVAFQQDYHGPNTFPLNFRRPDISSQMTGTYYSPYNNRIASYSNVNENIFSDSSDTPQDFRQGSNLGNMPKAFPSTQNMFFSMLNEPVRIIQNNDKQNMNLRAFQNSPTLMGSDRFNQQDQQYDIQLAFVPYETNYNVPSYSQNRQQEVAYPYAQQSNQYDTYQGFSHNYPAYGGSNLFSRSGIFSSDSIPSRYDMSYNFGRQNGNDRRFNYPIPTW